MKMMNTSLWIDFWFVSSWRVGELSTSQDMEVIIRGVAAGVPLSANGRACTIVSQETDNEQEGKSTPKIIKYSVIPVITSQQVIDQCAKIT